MFCSIKNLLNYTQKQQQLTETHTTSLKPFILPKLRLTKLFEVIKLQKKYQILDFWKECSCYFNR